MGISSCYNVYVYICVFYAFCLNLWSFLFICLFCSIQVCLFYFILFYFYSRCLVSDEEEYEKMWVWMDGEVGVDLGGLLGVESYSEYLYEKIYFQF